MSTVKEIELDGRKITFEFHKFAKQANGSVLVSSGGTQVLVTVCAQKEANPDLDFFPLGVDYIEKFYAAGRLPGGYLKREGKPTDQAALSARIIDRPLRPCFPKGFRNETVVTATVVSYEHGHCPVPLAVVGASCALMISDIPFDGPVACLRLGIKNGEYVIDPLEGDEKAYDLDLTIACRKDAVLMVEAKANHLSEEKMVEAISYAHAKMKPLFDLQEEIQSEFGKTKWVLAKKDTAELEEKIKTLATEGILEALSIKLKSERTQKLSDISKSLQKEFNPTSDKSLKTVVEKIVDKIKSNRLRQLILEEKVRLDGRALDEIRHISCEVGLLHAPHGSALFTRGETQALATITLASTDEVMRMETLWNADLRDNFMLHYNFPPFCVGEARMQRGAGRREIGHGNLAKKAIIPVLPAEEEFGYTIRLVSEVLESNGSSSMATVCAGTLALMNAGVPIKTPVAGIAMGLIKDQDNFAVLSDISGDEDHLGDMDFKVCGTSQGITALQMDIKISGITEEIFHKALEQAKIGRLFILEKMSVASESSVKSESNSPRTVHLKISQDKIKDLIGPSGKHIKKITADTGTKIDVQDKGNVKIIAPDVASAQAAKAMIRNYTTTPKVGDVYMGTALRVAEFGVFVELKPGTEGFCHITHLDDKEIVSVEDFIKVGDEMMIKVIDIDKQGRIKLSRKEAMKQRPV